jgi:cytoskeletal protein CcmA (bactofilin family)
MAAAATLSTKPSTSSLAPAVLGRKVTIAGEIHSREPLVIEGDVEGSIEVTGHLLTIAVDGKVRASVKATEVDVLGSLEGNVDGADKMFIRSGAHFTGDIHAHSLVIEDGAVIHGKVDLARKA